MPSEHPKFLGAPWIPGSTLSLSDHSWPLRAAQVPWSLPGPSEQLKPLRDPPKSLGAPRSTRSPSEHPSECLNWPSSRLPAGPSGSILLAQHPLPGCCPPAGLPPLPQPQGRAGRHRKEFPKSPEFPKPIFFIKIKPEALTASPPPAPPPPNSAAQGLLKPCDLQEKNHPKDHKDCKNP